MFNYVSPEQPVPQGHPLRAGRERTDSMLRSLNAEFDALYEDAGRPSIAPEYIRWAPFLQVCFPIRSELLLIEQIGYNLLFRWFIGLAWTIRCGITQNSRRAVHRNGTFVQAWASWKSFRPREGSDDDSGAFHGQKRTNQTHASSTGGEARLYKKTYGKESKLSYLAMCWWRTATA